MTVCIAALCDKRRTIAYAADRRISTPSFEAQPKSRKIIPIHPNWQLMYAGQDISPVFDIADYIEANLDPQKQYRVAEVNKVVEQAYEQKRSEIANVSKQPITTLAIQLLIFGFDQHGTAHVSYVSGLDGVVRRAGSPGWYAIGIGHVRR